MAAGRVGPPELASKAGGKTLLVTFKRVETAKDE